MARLKTLRAKSAPKVNDKLWEIRAAAEGEADVFIYGDIIYEEDRWWFGEDGPEVSAVSFRDELATLGDIKKINLYVASLGGSFPQALAIGSQLKRHGAYVHGHIDGFAASAATMILACCDKITAPRTAMALYHAPIGPVCGWFNAADLREIADDLDRFLPILISNYQDKTPDITEEALLELFAVNDWISAEEAKGLGLIDELVDDPAQVAASARALEVAATAIDVPEAVRDLLAAQQQPNEDPPASGDEEPGEDPRAGIIAQAQASIASSKEVRRNLSCVPGDISPN